MKKLIYFGCFLATIQLSNAQYLGGLPSTFGADVFHTGGNLGLGTLTPLTDLQIQERFHIHVRGAGTNITNNAWHNGSSYVYTTDGPASQFSMTGVGDMYIRNAEHGSAGNPVTWNNGIYIHNDGRVAIGTVYSTDMAAAPDYQLYVNKGIITEKLKVAVKANWPDFVFDDNYKLRSLAELEAYINANNHLPEVPSAEEVVKEGINVAEMDALLLQKIEELTLYVIQLEKQLNLLQNAKTN